MAHSAPSLKSTGQKTQLLGLRLLIGIAVVLIVGAMLAQFGVIGL